eukprot:4530485-Alexandrium_andersonii.AAC.1
MSASLVGSEMCIRDRPGAARAVPKLWWAQSAQLRLASRAPIAKDCADWRIATRYFTISGLRTPSIT